MALALLLPSAIAFSCDSLSGGDLVVCTNISASSLSSQEKDLLISDLFNKNKTTPDFDFIYSWNKDIQILNSPDGKTYSQGTINNAWIKIIFVSPSILDNGTLFIPNMGNIRTEYNYGYKLPSGTASGDCKTVYSLNNKKETLSVYLNNNLIGNSKMSSFSVYNQDNLTFKSKVNIQITYDVEHYKRVYYEKYSKCKYISSEYRTDSLEISDSLNSRLYNNSPSSTFEITDQYSDIVHGNLTANNYTNLILSFNNSEYKNSKYVYSLNYSLPYYILTIRADKFENSQISNVNINKINNSVYFSVRDSSNCKIGLDDFFNSITKACDLTFNPANFSIVANQTYYYENDTIGVFIYPSDLIVNITYANQTRLAKNYTEFKAVLYENRISARVNNTQEDWFVNIVKKENTDNFYDFSVLSIAGYIFFRFAKVYFLKLGV